VATGMRIEIIIGKRKIHHCRIDNGAKRIPISKAKSRDKEGC
jgi:hypothetical protein